MRPNPAATDHDLRLKRTVAYGIDALAAGIAGGILSSFSPGLGAAVAGGYMLLRDGLEFDYMRHRSLGKHFMNLHVRRLDGLPMDVQTSIRRNWPIALSSLAPLLAAFVGMGFLIGVAAVGLFLFEVHRLFKSPDGRRWGDEMAGTEVAGREGACVRC